MKVTLINYTGMGHKDPNFAAKLLAYTKNTRLNQGDDGLQKHMELSPARLAEELDYIATTIRSSWEFVSFQFQIIDVTRAFTHQFVRTRTASYAQQAQRVVDLSDMRVQKPNTVEANPVASQAWDEAVEAIKKAYGTMHAAGIPNQDCRGIVPTNILTNITAVLNLRTLADLVGKRQNLRAQGEYADVVKGMVDCVLEVMPWTKPFLFPEHTRTPQLDKMLKDALGDRSPIDVPEINAALKELDIVKGVWG